MRFDIVFTLVDLEHDNRDWYRAAAKFMCQSARAAFEDHDFRLIHLTDANSALCESADMRMELVDRVRWEEFSLWRAKTMADFALQATRPTIFCDVDLLWNNDSILHAFQADIVLCHRRMDMQPFNGGLILTQPNQTEFWTTYKQMFKHCPDAIKDWWCDQIAMAVMMGLPAEGQRGQVKFGSRIAYIPVDLACPSPKEQPQGLLNTPTVHFKGRKRKPWMTDYLGMLLNKAA